MCVDIDGISTCNACCVSMRGYACDGDARSTQTRLEGEGWDLYCNIYINNHPDAELWYAADDIGGNNIA